MHNVGVSVSVCNKWTESFQNLRGNETKFLKSSWVNVSNLKVEFDNDYYHSPIATYEMSQCIYFSSLARVCINYDTLVHRASFAIGI